MSRVLQMLRSTPAESASTASGGWDELERALRRAVGGEVRFDRGARALYASTGSNYRLVPIGVVVPRDVEDLVHAVDVCRAFDAPILGRGAGTSLAGQSGNIAVVLDTSKHLTRVLEVDPDRRVARVEPGVVLDQLRNAAAPHGLTFAPDPSTHAYCTLGGMIGNNSCGVHSVKGGRTAENVEELEILTYDGARLRVGPTTDERFDIVVRQGGRQAEIYRRLRALRDRHADEIRRRFPKLPRRVSGYNLDELLPERGFNLARALVGTEGTCALTLEATVRLVPSPAARVLLVLGFEDVYAAADRVPDVLEAGPLGLEGMDDRLVGDMRAQGLHADYASLLPPGGGWLLTEFGGDTRDSAAAAAQRLMDRMRQGPQVPSMQLITDSEEQHHLWIVRESGLGATAFVPGESPTWEGWEDSAVPPDKLGGYLRDLRRLLDRYGYRGDLYGHFGDGCVHTRTDFDFRSDEGVARFRSFLEDAADLVVSYGGSLSGEHGDGQARGELLPRMFGEELTEAFAEFKSIWDPSWRMNPGKVVRALPLDFSLRLDEGYQPPATDTHFSYRREGGTFADAALRCVGVGACRKTNEGTMCPSYMVTREEMHSTRGRARLLFEMLRGDVLTGGWRDEHVKEALDLCLACKACKDECPVSVDMARYKAEFLAHYYEGRLRPLFAYGASFIPWLARMGSGAPWAANAIAGAPFVSSAIKRLSGIAQHRRLPRFASRSFRRQFGHDRNTAAGKDMRVLLWPDTFNNYFRPESAVAAAEVLESAGFQVELPSRWVCCGRPLYEYGMLGLAKRRLEATLDVLRPSIQARVPVVVLEPSCLSVFRDELCGLLPDDPDAQRLKDLAVGFGEFLVQEVDLETVFRPLYRTALLHGHCHQKAFGGNDQDARLLRRLGVEVQALDSGCCGMAGAFGFHKDHYEVSIRAGERVLLPAVREAAADTLLVVDGFSCREQVEQTTARRGLHLAEVARLALRRPAPAHPAKAASPLALPTLLIGAGVALAVLFGSRRFRGGVDLHMADGSSWRPSAG